MKNYLLVIVMAMAPVFISCGGNAQRGDLGRGPAPEGLGASLSMDSSADVEAFAGDVLNEVIASQLDITDNVFDLERSANSNTRIIIPVMAFSIAGEDSGEMISNGSLEAAAVNINNPRINIGIVTDYNGYSPYDGMMLDGSSDWSLAGNLSNLNFSEVNFNADYSSSGSVSVSGAVGAAVEFQIKIAFEGSDIDAYFENSYNFESFGITGSIDITSGNENKECNILGNIGGIIVRCR